MMFDGWSWPARIMFAILIFVLALVCFGLTVWFVVRPGFS